MGRIRTIKPEFPQSESVGHLSRDARLLFLLLFTVVDDEGRSRGSSRILASLLYPYDDDARGLIDGWIAELEQNSMVRRYVYEDNTYLEIINFKKHQKIDHPSESKFPAFDESSRILANPREKERGIKEGIKDQGEYQEGLAPLLPVGNDSEYVRLQIFPELWNQLCGNLPKVEKFTDSRKKKVKARITQGVSSEKFIEAIKACTMKPFLRGDNDRGWTATFDWLIENDLNIEKAINNPYGPGHDRNAPKVNATLPPNPGATNQTNEVDAYTMWQGMSEQFKKENPWRAQ